MATRFYIQAGSTPSVTPAFDAGWSSASAAVRRVLGTTKDATTEQSTASITSGANNSALVVQAVSPPLAAQTIVGTFSMVGRVLEISANDNVTKRHRSIRVYSGDGLTLRGTLSAYAATASTTEITTTFAGQQHAINNGVTSVDCLEGDVIVVEWGYGMSGTGTSPQVTMEWGGDGTDHANANADTTGTVMWVEFSQTLTFAAQPLPLTEATVAATAVAVTPTPGTVNVNLTPAVQPITAQAQAVTAEAPTVALTPAGGGTTPTVSEPPHLNKGFGVAARNGTTSHTMNFGFTPATGTELLVIMSGAVTHTASGGWTERLQPVNSSELSVFTKTSAGETSITVTHNGSNYPVAWVAYELPAGSTWVTGTSISNTSDTSPTLTGLPGTPVVVWSARNRNVSAGATSASTTWSDPWLEDIDLFEPEVSTNGAFLTVGHRINVTDTTATPSSSTTYSAGTFSNDRQHVVFAFDVPASAGTASPQLVAVAVTATPLAVNVTLTPAVAAGAALSLSATPGPVTTSIQPAPIGSTAIAVQAESQASGVTLTPASLTASAPIVVAMPTLTSGVGTFSAVPVTATPDPVQVTLTAASATVAAHTLTMTPGAVTVALSLAAAALSAQAATPEGIPGASAPLTSASAGALALAVTATPGSVTVALAAATATRSAVPVTATPGLVTVALAAAAFAAAAQSVTATPGSVTVTLTGATISSEGVNLSPVPGMITTSVQTANVGTWTAVAVSPAELEGILLQPAWATLTPRQTTPEGKRLPLNTYELPLAKVLLNCLQEVLTTQTDNPPQHFALRVGEQVPFDLSENEDLCCEGLAYVKINRVYPSTAFPNEDEGFMPCGPLAWAADLEMGILRCSPTGDINFMPTDAEWADATELVAEDSAAMRLAIACFRDRVSEGIEWVPRSWIPIGPVGACTGGTQIVTVGFIPC